MDSGGDRVSNSLSYTYKVNVDGPSAVEAHEGFLRIKNPVSGSAKGTKVICVGWWHNGRCRGGSTSERADARVRATGIVDVAIGITPDYTLTVNPSVAFKFDGKTHLKMDLFGDAIRINIDITPKIQSLLNSQATKLTGKLQTKLTEMAQQIDVRQQAEAQWAAIGQGIKSGDAWVQFSPEKVLFRGIHPSAAGSMASLGIGFEGPVKVSLTKPRANTKPLPPVETVDRTDPVLELNVPLHSAFTDLEREVNEKLAGYEYVSDDYRLEISKIRLNGMVAGDVPAVLIGVGFTGHRDTKWYDPFFKRVKGTLYFKAVPEIDAATQVVGIKDFEMTSETSSLLFDKGFPWIIQLKQDEIISALRVDLKPKIEELLTKSNEQLASGVPVGPIVIKGSVLEAGLAGFNVTNHDLEIYAKARAEIRTEYKAADEVAAQ